MTNNPSELTKQIQAKSPSALRQVIETYMPQILRAARGAGLDADMAEDVTQATFTTFLEKADSFEGRSHVRTWLFGILYRKIAEARRELKRAAEFDSIDEVVEQRFNDSGSYARPPRPIETDVHNEQIRKQIHGCMDGLSIRSGFGLGIGE